MGAAINSDLTQNLDGVYNNADPRTYPMSSYSYMIVPTQPTKVFTAEKGKTLSKFADYMICEGQQQASALGYSPLPMNLAQAASDVIKTIPGTVGGVDFNSCNNPTFKPGDSPSNNQLAATARCPPTATSRERRSAPPARGATVDTPVTGTGGSGQATSGSGGGRRRRRAAAAAGAAAGGSDPVYDANGNLVSERAPVVRRRCRRRSPSPPTAGECRRSRCSSRARSCFAPSSLPPLLSRRLRGSKR
jgi:hypothetical protein